jgi:thiol-disulfide isomerase/thioredoxin
MTRRRIFAAAMGLAAAGAGFAWAWHRGTARSPEAGAAGRAPSALDVWNLRFETPQGGELELATLRGRPLLLNFWAPWCPPCVEELPMLDRFQREHRGGGWQVLGLAVDGAQPVREFLARRPVGFAIGLAATQGVSLSRMLGNSGGALPFSVAFDSRGAAVERKLGILQWAELVAWADRIH